MENATVRSPPPPLPLPLALVPMAWCVCGFEGGKKRRAPSVRWARGRTNNPIHAYQIIPYLGITAGAPQPPAAHCQAAATDTAACRRLRLLQPAPATAAAAAGAGAATDLFALLRAPQPAGDAHVQSSSCTASERWVGAWNNGGGSLGPALVVLMEGRDPIDRSIAMSDRLGVPFIHSFTQASWSLPFVFVRFRRGSSSKPNHVPTPSPSFRRRRATSHASIHFDPPTPF